MEKSPSYALLSPPSKRPPHRVV